MKKKKIFLVLILLLTLAFLFVRTDDDDPYRRRETRSPDLLLVAGINNPTGEHEPALIHIDPNDNFSLKNIDLGKFSFNFMGIHEARSILVNDEYKIALGAYSSNEDHAEQTEFIILNNGSFGFDNLEIEFREQINDARIRAVFVEDIDNDGEQEIVIGTRPHGILRYYKFIDNQWMGFDIDFRNEIIHDILIADINKNGINEIFITTSPKTSGDRFNISFKPLDPTGKIISYELNPYTNTWRKEIVRQYIFHPQSPSGENFPKHARYLFASDIDGDGSKEIVVNVLGPKDDNSNNSIELLKWNGLDYSREIIENNLDIHDSTIAVDDIDFDGKDEILAFTEIDGTLLLYSYEYGTWKTEILAKNIAAGDRTINSLYAIDSPDNSYKKIFYILSPILNINTPAIDTTLFYLEHIDSTWEKKYIDTINQSLVVWGIFSGSPD